MEEEEVVYLKVFDEKRGDVVFEGKVSTDVEPQELVKLNCFRNRHLRRMHNKATNEEVKSFKGLQNNVELIAGRGDLQHFSGVLYVGADDGVMRKSKTMPLCECVMMTVWDFSHEESEKVFKCETLDVLEIDWCKLKQIPTEIGKMMRLKKLGLVGLNDLKSIPEEMRELSNLEELRVAYCGIERLVKGLKDLKMLRTITLVNLTNLQLNADDLVVFSKLDHLNIKWCRNAFTAPLSQSFWEMIKSTTYLRELDLDWWNHDQEMVVAALEENGSIVDGGKGSDQYVHIFRRNKENHERALQCVLRLLAIRRWRNALKGAPKEMIRMLAMMLWTTKCDVNAWRREVGRGSLKKARRDE